MTTQTDASPFRVQTLKNPSPSSVATATSQQRQFNFERDTLPTEKRFVERRNLRTDDIFEYKRNGDDPGLILIFNQETFQDETLGTRKGSRRDVNEIAVCFQRLGFNIDENNHIMTDFTTSEIQQTLKEVAARDLSKYNCLIIFVLSHGEEFNQIHTRDGLINADQIWSEFKPNLAKSLANKPKMFVFQACKGDNFSTTGIQKTPSSSTSSVIAPMKTFTTSFLYPDLLIVYSSVEGNSSFRNSLTGSWFIQEMCKNFSSYGKKDDVINMIIRTTKCVCANYFHPINISEKPDTVYKVNQKQMPFFVSTLKKKFFLNSNKDRDLLIRIAESNKEILKNLEHIKIQLKTVLDKS